MNVREILKQGIEARVLADAKREASLPPAMRFGNSGAIIDGVVFGNCPRLAHLRLLGFQTASDASTQVMFASGRAMEHILYDFLSAALPPERIKREDEAAIKYLTPSGLPVTGRPDFILLDENGNYETGIECKGKMSFWGVKSLLIDGKGYASHIVQGAHYMWKHGLKNYGLTYVVPVKYLIPREDKAVWPKEYIGRSGGGWAVNPQLFTLLLSTAADGTLVVEMHDGVVHKTKLKVGHIDAFYASVEEMGEGKPLAPMPSAKGVFGKPSWKACDYCPLKDVCDTETAYGPWLDKAVDTITGTWQENWPDFLDEYLGGWV